MRNDVSFSTVTPPQRELLPRPVRLLLGATSPGVGDDRLRRAVEGRVVLVTGASSGVGEASARRLAAAGAEVLLVARTVSELERVRDEIAAAGGSAHVHRADLADVESVEALAAAVLERHGHVDVIVNNAGLSIRRWIAESYDRFHDFQRTIDVNYLGPVRLLLALLPSMRERGEGHIVNVATTGVDMPPMAWTAYIASKNAFETWLRGVAPEVRADGVTTTIIHLQLVRSPMLRPVPDLALHAGHEHRRGGRDRLPRDRRAAARRSRRCGRASQVRWTPPRRRRSSVGSPATPGSRARPARRRAARVADDALSGLLALRSTGLVRARAAGPARPRARGPAPLRHDAGARRPRAPRRSIPTAPP